MWHDFLVKGKNAKLLIFAGVILLLCVGIALVQLTHAGSKQASSGRQQTTVDVAGVQRTDLIKHIALSGQTVPAAQVDIAAKYQGRVVAVNVMLGQQVAPGQVLVVQDTGDADIAIMQNQASYQQAASDAVTSEATVNANYDKAKADYQRALASYERNKMVYGSGGISQDELEVSQQQVSDAKAAVDALANQMNSGVAASVQSYRAAAQKAQYSVTAVEKQRNDLVIRAPRAGVIGYRQVEAGDLVSAGQKLLSIFDNSSIYIDCQVAEQDLSALSNGLAVNVQLESLGKTLPGRIIYISPAADAQNLTFSARIMLENPGPEVRSGMFARAVIDAPLRQNVLVVAKDAVQEKDGTAYVFVVGSGNVIEQRAVQIGARGDQNVEIITGLVEGEQIALTNLARLRSGMVVISHSSAADDRGDNS
ncbi:MAG: mdtE 1 [Firmicutes bacterium]|nr:mdtE 1 [Bacillota bacterium]